MTVTESRRDEMDYNAENKEIAKVQKFIKDGCGCRRGSKSIQCSDQFTVETVLNNLYNCLELSHAVLDLVVLANIQAFTASEETGEKRKRSPPYSFLYHSQPICKEMFLNLYGISKSRFQRLLEHFENHGISLRIHGNSKRLPHNVLPVAIAEDVKSFRSNFVDENAVLLPGRIPGFKMKISNCFHRMKPKCMCGGVLKEPVRSQTSKLCVTQNLSTCGNSFFQMLSLPSL